MERNRGFWILMCGFFLTLNLPAQDHRFMVFFSDKGTVYSLEEPLEFLSQRAVDRRVRQGVSLIEQDLPVNPIYIQGLRDLGVNVWYSTKWFNGVLVETDSAQLTTIQSLSYVTGVEHVAPGPLMPQTGKVKSFKHKKRQVSGSRTQSTDFQNHILGIDEMHNSGFKGEGMLIAVFDGGFEGVNNAPAFQHLITGNRVQFAYDFVGNSSNVYRYDDHGTRALSVIGGNESGVFTGGAYEADFVLCVTEDVFSEYRVEEYNWAFAAEAADSAGVDIINTSLGYNIFDDARMNYTTDDLDGQTTVISQAASIAATKGMVLTMSAGNSGNVLWQKITAPADALDVLAVGAINSDSTKASFSSFGPSADQRIKPDVVALGVSTALINSNGTLVFNNGTSFSAPQVASLVAGFWQNNPELNYRQVIASIKNSGDQALNPDIEKGSGIPNFIRAGQVILELDEDRLQKAVTLFPNPLGQYLFLVSKQPISEAWLTMHSITGQGVVESKLSNIKANQKIPVDLPALDPGVYIVTLRSDRHTQSFRLIKY